MRHVIRHQKDFLAGILFVAFGLFFLYEALNYSVGNVRRMGPGWFPIAVASILVGAGAIIFLKSFFGERDHVPRHIMLPFGLILGCVVCYFTFYLLRRAGVTATSLGPAWVVLAAAIVLGFTALVVFIRNLFRHEDDEEVSWRPLVLVTAAMVAFTLLLRPAGVVPAVFVLVMISAFAYPPVNLQRMPLVALGLAVFSWIAFVELLGLPMPKFGQTLDLYVDPYLEPIRAGLRAARGVLVQGVVDFFQAVRGIFSGDAVIPPGR